jgi:rod shape-determining protein MreB and related proteins
MSILTRILDRSASIDLGTSNTLIYLGGKGIVLREPSVVAISKDNGSIIAVGTEAKNMIGRTPKNIIIIRPLKDGVIADFDITKIMLRYFFSKISKWYSGSLPRFVVSAPLGITEVEKRAILEAVKQSGGKSAVLVDNLIASALGANLSIEGYMGNMIVDVGGGKCETGLISMGGIVSSKSVRIGGENIDEIISAYIKKQYRLLIGERTAEEIKINLDAGNGIGKSALLEIRGKDLVRGMPKLIQISAVEIEDVLSDIINVIAETVKRTLEMAPLESSIDIMEKGIVMTGGSSLLKGLSKAVSEKTGVPVYVTEDPMDCAVIGAAKILHSLKIIERASVVPQKI